MEKVTLTLAEASAVLSPPIAERALRDLIRALPAIRPAGLRRHTGGRPAATFDMADILKVHAAVAPWLATAARNAHNDP